MFKFEYDQQDSYELYHRIIEVIDSFICKYKKCIEKELLSDKEISGKINLLNNKKT